MTGKRTKPKNENFLDTDQFARELAQRAKFSLSDTKIFMKEYQGIFEDCIEQNIDIDLRGFVHLYIQTIPAHDGNNARESRLRGGEPVKQWFPESKRITIKVAKNLTDILRSPEKRKIQNSKSTKDALRQMTLDENMGG
jgi:hypothetical protein